MSLEFEVIASGFQFAEAPRIDARGTVYFSDLTGGGYYRCRPGSPVETVLASRAWIGGAVFARDGAMLLSGKGGIVRLDLATGGTRALLTEVCGTAIVAVNDIEAEPSGGLFGGTVDFAAILERGETPHNGQFFHLSAKGKLTLLRDGLVASNGLGFSPDGKYLYHSESTRGVWIYTLNSVGLPGAPTLFAALEDSDGLTVDADGGVWVACWKSARLLRYRPDGVLARQIELPFPHIVSLAFGGPELSDLFVTTGGNDADPGKGGVIRIRCDVPGLPEHRYG
jgi:xylono-1,5-lactonase